eukprot:c28772_g1_i1 orf=120-3080(+)
MEMLQQPSLVYGKLFHLPQPPVTRFLCQRIKDHHVVATQLCLAPTSDSRSQQQDLWHLNAYTSLRSLAFVGRKNELFARWQPTCLATVDLEGMPEVDESHHWRFKDGGGITEGHQNESSLNGRRGTELNTPVGLHENSHGTGKSSGEVTEISGSVSPDDTTSERDKMMSWHPSELENVELATEKELRFVILESLMLNARLGDVGGAEESISDMASAGLKAGPRTFHGLVTAYCQSGDAEGALQALRREVTAGQQPLPETFVALVRSFGARGQAQRGQEVLAAMERYKLDPRQAWLILVEELFQAGYLKDANGVFVRGAEGGLEATDYLYDILVQENAKVGDHASAITILRYMEYTGRMATTFHYNCLLMIEANAGEADIAEQRFENMLYGRDYMKPDTESYNWLIQAHTRSQSGGDRLQAVVDLLGVMVEDYKQVQPNARTYALIVECFTKFHLIEEAVRHFRALSKFPGGIRLLNNDGGEGDSLSLYLRAVCLSGRADDLLEALQVMVKEKQSISSRAMLVNRKGRTLVSSWIEPLQQEAELGYEVDYIAKYIAEGGLTGTRKRWSPSEDGKILPYNPDSDGFAFGAPMELSFKIHCFQLRMLYASRLLEKLKREGVTALGDGASESDLAMVMKRLANTIIVEPSERFRKPKAASKMLVSELKEELAAQGLSVDGTRPVLYQRVQRARKINRARGVPLWVPPALTQEEELFQVDDEINKYISRLTLKPENTEYQWNQFLEAIYGKGSNKETRQKILYLNSSKKVNLPSSKGEDADNSDNDDDDDGGAAEEADNLTEDGDEEEPDPPAMLGTQLWKSTSDISENQDHDAEPSVDLTFEETLAKHIEDRWIDASDMYTIADVWGWTWEKELNAQKPEKWSQEMEVRFAMQIMQTVQDLGGIPTIGDCAMLLRAARRTPWPEAMVKILQSSHKLGYVFGSALYDEVVTCCMRLYEKDAAIAIVTDMEDAGISVPDEILDRILQDEFHS